MHYYIDTEFHEEPGCLELISIGIVAANPMVGSVSCATYYAESADIDLSICNDWVKKNVVPHLSGNKQGKRKPRSQIKEELLYLMKDDENPVFWGYFCDYDWVLFCWLFGRMIDLPKNFPMYCRDLKQLMDHYSIHKGELPAQSGTSHHALEDARWIHKAHVAINTIVADRRLAARGNL